MRYGYGDRVGRTNCHECNEGFIYMSCGVVPSRHIVPALSFRGLRPRLLSLRSVLPSRQIVLNEILLPTNCTNFRASECKTELVRVMPSAAENVKEIDTKAMRYGNGDRVGRTNWHECNEFFIYMSCGVVPLLRDFH